MDKIVLDLKQSVDKTLNFLKEELKTIRTGKSNPSLIENLIVETYGGDTKLRLLELATIINEGPTALSVTPFDPSVISDIEKAILKSPIGISPAIQGSRILVKVPSLSQEQREKFIKLVGQKIEDTKKTIRDFRDNARKKIKLQYEAKTLREDEKFRLEKDIDNEVQRYMEEIQEIRDKKEKEIMEI